MAFEQFEKALDSWDKKVNQDPSGCYPLIVAKHFWKEALRCVLENNMCISDILKELGEYRAKHERQQAEL